MVEQAVDGGTGSPAPVRPVLRGPRGARGEVRRRIREAALRSFADHGLDGASTRSIARDADCDPALVRYYFSSKQELFEQVVRRPAALDDQLEEMASLPHDERAAYLADLVEQCWDDPATSPFWRSLLRTAATDDAVARQLEDTWSEFVALGVVVELAAVRGRHLDGARLDGAALDGRALDGASELPGRPATRRHSVVALNSITGMLAALHVWSSRRTGDLSAHERSAALAEVLELCFTDPAER